MAEIITPVEAQKLYLKDMFTESNNIYIPQSHNGDFSHEGTGASDFDQVDGNNYSPIYAPCDLVLKFTKDNTSSGNQLDQTNTIMYQSRYDIQFTDGTSDYVCLGFAHMRDAEYNALKAQYGSSWRQGLIIPKGSLIYNEGTKMGGSNTGCSPHVHIRFGKGAFASNSTPWKKYPSNTGPSVLNCTGTGYTTADKVFFVDDINFTYNSAYASANDYNWVTTD